MIGKYTPVSLSIPVKRFVDILSHHACKNSQAVIIDAGTGVADMVMHCSELEKQGQLFLNECLDSKLIELCRQLVGCGKVPFLFAPSAFVTAYCNQPEMIKLFIDMKQIVIAGLGLWNDEILRDPPIAQVQDISAFRMIPGMSVYSISNEVTATAIAQICLTLPGPKYIRMNSEKQPCLYNTTEELNVTTGLTHLTEGRDLCIISTGRMVHRALELADALGK